LTEGRWESTTLLWTWSHMLVRPGRDSKFPSLKHFSEPFTDDDWVGFCCYCCCYSHPGLCERGWHGLSQKVSPSKVIGEGAWGGDEIFFYFNAVSSSDLPESRFYCIFPKGKYLKGKNFQGCGKRAEHLDESESTLKGIAGAQWVKWTPPAACQSEPPAFVQVKRDSFHCSLFPVYVLNEPAFSLALTDQHNNWLEAYFPVNPPAPSCLSISAMPMAVYQLGRRPRYSQLNSALQAKQIFQPCFTILRNLWPTYDIGTEVGHLAPWVCSTIYLDHGWCLCCVPHSCSIPNSGINLINLSELLPIHLYPSLNGRSKLYSVFKMQS